MDNYNGLDGGGDGAREWYDYNKDNDDNNDGDNNNHRKEINGLMDVENRLLAPLKHYSINFCTTTYAPAPATKALLSGGFVFGTSASGNEKKADPVSATASSAGRFSFNAISVRGKQDRGTYIPGFVLGIPLPVVAAKGQKG